MKLAAVSILLLALTGCSRTATITVDPGLSNNKAPYVDCHVGVPNPDYQPTTKAG